MIHTRPRKRGHPQFPLHCPPHHPSAKEIVDVPFFYPRRHRGVTLIETLAAIALLATVLPVLSRAWVLSMDTASRSQNQVIAASLAEDRLAEMVIEKDFSQAESSGDFGDEHPGFTWTATQGDWELDGRFRLITVTVTWTRRQIVYELPVSTLVDPTGT